MRRSAELSWVALLLALVALFIALLGPDEGPRGLMGSAGPQGIQGPRGADGTQTVVYRDRRPCPRLLPPAVFHRGAEYAWRLVEAGRCPTYQLAPIFGRWP